MHEVYDKLRALQETLSKKFELEKELRDIPKTLSTKQELLSRLKKSYIERNRQYEETRGKIGELKVHLQEAEAGREHYEEQMDLIKTQREYEALDKEIRDASEKEQFLRKELQREEKGLEEMSRALEREETMIKQQEEELTEEQEKIKTQSDDKHERLRELEAEESRITPELDDELLFKFERIIRSKEGQGIVPLRKGVCTYCNMILPNQLVNDVRSGEDIHFCPYCSLVLFYQEDDEAAAYDDSESEGLSDIVDMDDYDDFGDILAEQDVDTTAIFDDESVLQKDGLDEEEEDEEEEEEEDEEDDDDEEDVDDEEDLEEPLDEEDEDEEDEE